MAKVDWRKLGLWIAAAALLAAGLVLGLRGLLKGLIADPLVRLWWLIDSLPQGLIWLAVAALGAAVGLRAWLALPEREGRRRLVPAGEARPRLSELAALIRRAEYSGTARRRLAARLARLAVSARARRESIPPQVAWRELRAGRWPEDETLRAVLSPPRALSRPGDFLSALEQGLDALTQLTKGGRFDDS
ncbi:hypothetical protein DRJ54_05150 [Candidatus Acetothermia bacterium]|nr:MAG: hypothetical protein DRJ54_05150 [Candidatus Acetothermia bacterium]